LQQDLDEEGQKIEILFCWRKCKWIDGKVLGLNANPDIGTPKKFGKAFKASAKIEDETCEVRISGDW